MEFRETLLAAQKNQQQKSSENLYYKAKFDPPKKENKPRDKLSANIQKFLAKKEEEERQKKIEAIRKRDELLAMRDPKAMRKIQKSLKVFKSANKSVIEDAIDRDNTAVTREGPSQPDQDDYGYESQNSSALYEKIMEKYSKIPDEPKFPGSSTKTKKDLDGTRERVKQALLHVDDPVPHKRRRKNDIEDKEPSPQPKSEQEKKRDEKPKIRKPAPPPMDFNELLKLAEQKKAEPLDLVPKKVTADPEPERLMTKRQRREHEEEMARRMRRQQRLEAEKAGPRKIQKEERAPEKEKKTMPSGFGRIPKLGAKLPNNNVKNDSPKSSNSARVDKDKLSEKDRSDKTYRDKERPKSDNQNIEKDKERAERDKLEKLKAERERIERDIERLSKDKERIEKTKMKLESSYRGSDSVDRSKLGSREQELKKKIDLKSQNTYRIDKGSSEKKGPIQNRSSMNGQTVQGKAVPKVATQDASRQNGLKPENGKRLPEQSKPVIDRPEDRKAMLSGGKGSAQGKPKVVNSFDFDKHVSSLKNGQSSGVKKPNGARQFPPGDVKRKMHPDDIRRKQMMKRRVVNSDSEHDSEMDDFIDDDDIEEDYSKHIKEIFNYDRSKYRYIDDEDDPSMESSFSRQMQEEYVSKKIGIMEDLEDMRLEKQMNMKKKKRRISDD